MTQVVLTHENLATFFHELVATSVSAQRIRVTTEAQSYLVSLLQDFTKSNRLFAGPQEDSGDRDADSGAPTLAWLLRDALQAAAAERVRAFRRLGDVSLFVSGFFADSLTRQRVDIDYYVGMGGAAYAQVAVLVRGSGAYRGLYAELSEKFGALVDVLGDVSERANLPTAESLVRLYERWLATRSARLAARLVAHGLAPVPGTPRTRN